MDFPINLLPLLFSLSLANVSLMRSLTESSPPLCSRYYDHLLLGVIEVVVCKVLWLRIFPNLCSGVSSNNSTFTILYFQSFIWFIVQKSFHYDLTHACNIDHTCMHGVSRYRESKYKKEYSTCIAMVQTVGFFLCGK